MWKINGKEAQNRCSVRVSIWKSINRNSCVNISLKCTCVAVCSATVLFMWHLFVCGTECAQSKKKASNWFFVIHNIPLTCLNCLLILLNVGRTSGKRASAYTTSNSAPARTQQQHSAYSYVCNGPVRSRRQWQAKKKKKQKQFWVLPRHRRLNMQQNHLRLHCIRWLPICTHTHTQTRLNVQFYYALCNSQQQQQWSIYKCYQMNWKATGSRCGSPSIQCNGWFLLRSRSQYEIKTKKKLFCTSL